MILISHPVARFEALDAFARARISLNETMPAKGQ
jgi:hypothetical protein